jgi:uncharacterized protein YdhG (YjbR/CyaY superfamily)
MARTDFKSVAEYIASQPEAVREILGQVRSAIRAALPGAEEAISYQIPAYKTHGRAVLYFAGWKQHDSLYPVTAGVAAAFREELAAYKVSKGTIRFPLCQPVPVRLIGRIAKLRAKEAAEREKAGRKTRPATRIPYNSSDERPSGNIRSSLRTAGRAGLIQGLEHSTARFIHTSMFRSHQECHAEWSRRISRSAIPMTVASRNPLEPFGRLRAAR